MQTRRPHVVIVGGGFGGLEAAKGLDGAPVDVTLIDRANYHLFQPLLYQVAMAGLSPADIASPIRSILAKQKNARVLLGSVTGIDVDARRVEFDGETMAYDWLVLAVGAQSSYFGHDDWERYAPSLKGIEDALEIRKRVLLAFERAECSRGDENELRRLLTFVVIGGGPTGVELAGAVAELARFVLARDFRAVDPRYARVVLVEAGARILPTFEEHLAKRAVEQLAELGVEVKTGARVIAVDEVHVELEEGDNARDLPGLGSGRDHESIPCGTVLWGAGVRPNPLAASLGVPLDRQGRVQVRSDCSIPGHPEVFAVGDIARFEESGNPLPGVSPVAMQEARYVAHIIRRELDAPGEAHREPFAYHDKGSMATIGRSRAIAQMKHLRLSGLLAWLAWLFVHLWYLVGFRNRFAVFFNWAWSYVTYKRGARLITETGWGLTRARAAQAARAPTPPRPQPEMPAAQAFADGRTVPSRERENRPAILRPAPRTS